MNDNDEENQQALVERHLRWSSKQGSILSGGFRADALYRAERGFPFRQEELPHHHLLQNNTQRVFAQWKETKAPASIIAGVWNRPLFVGGWDHSTDHEELVYNIQTHALFVDLRIPRSKKKVLNKIRSLHTMTGHQLKLYARQHVFAGFSVLSHEDNKPVCTRHHCLDWNFVGQPRTRPNKWWIKMRDDQTCWKEYSYATDEDGQHYYWERWELRGQRKSPRLAFRKMSQTDRDGVLVVVGDHFNYVLGRTHADEMETYNCSSLVDLVDTAVAAGDLETARYYLGIEGGHGTVSSGWQLDCAIQPWDEGKRLWEANDVSVIGDSIESAVLCWKGEQWAMFDCSFKNIADLRSYLERTVSLGTKQYMIPSSL